MLAAEFNGKSSTLTSEDVLTSHVFSLFRYLTCLSIPFQFLCCARNAGGHLLPLIPSHLVAIKFWPKFSLPAIKSHREADVLILVREESGRLASILIEAKFRSGLSNNQLGAEGDISNYRPGHQLADEYIGLTQGRLKYDDGLRNELETAEKRILIYVTAHHEFPKTDVMTAISAASAYTNSRDIANENIYWLAWWRLYEIIDTELSARRCNYSLGETNILNDIQSALRLRNLDPFRPFQDLSPIRTYFSLAKTSSVFNLPIVGKYSSLFPHSPCSVV